LLCLEAKKRKLTQQISGYSAYLVVGEELRPLPIGSTFDSERGVLYWQPGPGFLGDYEFVFIVEEISGKRKIPVRVTIKPQVE